MKYNIKNIHADSVILFKNCFDENGSPKRIDQIIWQFFKAPVKKQFVDILVDESNNKVVAIYAVFPVTFSINGAIRIGCQSLDTITDINYRGQGWFVKLARDVYQKVDSEGISLVYGFPNGNSIHGFKNKLKWTVLDPVPFLIKPLRSQYFTKKIKLLRFFPNVNLFLSRPMKISKKYKFVEDFSFPDSVDSLWRSFSMHFCVSVCRDKTYLEWRYLAKPSENYKVVHCYDNNSNYLGFVIYTIKTKHGGKIAYLMELIYDLSIPEVGKLLVKYATKEIIKDKADCILAWGFEHAPNYKSYKLNGFFSFPEKLRPIELHFGVNCFDSAIAGIVNNRKNWYISYSDSDTV